MAGLFQRLGSMFASSAPIAANSGEEAEQEEMGGAVRGSGAGSQLNGGGDENQASGQEQIFPGDDAVELDGEAPQSDRKKARKARKSLEKAEVQEHAGEVNNVQASGERHSPWREPTPLEDPNINGKRGKKKPKKKKKKSAKSTVVENAQVEVVPEIKQEEVSFEANEDSADDAASVYAPEVEAEAAALAQLLNEASKRKRVTPLAADLATPNVVIKPSTRPSLMSASKSAEPEQEVSEDEHTLLETLAMSKKKSKSKKKNKRVSKEVVDGAVKDIQGSEDVNPAEELLNTEAPAHANSEGVDDNDEPAQPSAKALGKRKASSEVPKPAKKRSKQKDRGSNADIRAFGTVTSSQLRPQSPRDDGADHESESRPQEEQAVKSIVRAPHLQERDANQRNGRRETPQFTPINRKKDASRTVPTSDAPRSFSVEISPIANGESHDASPADLTAPHDLPTTKKSKTSSLSNGESSSLDKQPKKKSRKSKPKATATASDATDPAPKPTKRKRKSATSLADHAESADTSTVDAVRSKRRSTTKDTPVVGESADANQGDGSTASNDQHEPPTSSTKPKRKRRLPTGEPPASETPGTKTKRSKAAVDPRGKLTDEEAEQVVAALEAYRENNNLQQYEVNDLIQRRFQHSKEFWQEIRSRVPSAHGTNITTFCKRRYHNYIRGAWTMEQDEELREVYERIPNKWTEIGAIINRYPEDARLRHRDYVCLGDKMITSPWNKPEEERLESAVQQCLTLIRQSKAGSGDQDSANDESQIDWRRVSELMDLTRSRLQCWTKWRTMQQRRKMDAQSATLLDNIGSSEWRLSKAAALVTEMDAAEKLVLLKAIRWSGAADETKIPWRIIGEDMNRKGHKMVLKVCIRNLRTQVNGHDERPLQDVISVLIDAFEAAAPNHPQDFRKEDVWTTMSKTPMRNAKLKLGSSKDTAAGAEDRYEVEYFNSETASRRHNRYKKHKSDKSVEVLGDARPRATKKRRRSKIISDEVVVDDSDNAEDTRIAEPEKPQKKKRKTVRERIAQPSHDESQDVSIPPASDDGDIGEQLQSGWEAVSTPRAKKPIVTAKTSQRTKSKKKSKTRENENNEGLSQASQVIANGKSSSSGKTPIHVRTQQVDEHNSNSDNQEDLLLNHTLQSTEDAEMRTGDVVENDDSTPRGSAIPQSVDNQNHQPAGDDRNSMDLDLPESDGHDDTSEQRQDEATSFEDRVIIESVEDELLSQHGGDIAYDEMSESDVEATGRLENGLLFEAEDNASSNINGLLHEYQDGEEFTTPLRSASPILGQHVPAQSNGNEDQNHQNGIIDVQEDEGIVPNDGMDTAPLSEKSSPSIDGYDDLHIKNEDFQDDQGVNYHDGEDEDDKSDGSVQHGRRTPSPIRDDSRISADREDDEDSEPFADFTAPRKSSHASENEESEISDDEYQRNTFIEDSDFSDGDDYEMGDNSLSPGPVTNVALPPLPVTSRISSPSRRNLNRHSRSPSISSDSSGSSIPAIAKKKVPSTRRMSAMSPEL